MKLSVVTVVKDDLEGLRKTFGSIVDQSRTVSWTIVTPNDRSILHDFVLGLKAKNLIDEILEDDGIGVYEAMNKAINAADPNNWLWFLNSGDTFANRYSYEIVEQVLLESKIDWLYGGHYLGSSSGQVLAAIPAPKKFKPKNQLFSKKYISHQSSIFSVKILRELGGFDTRLKIAGDWDLMVRAHRISEGMRISDLISTFYMGGLSTLNRQAGNRELLEVRNRLLPKKFLLKNYYWFFYRKCRNYIVEIIEKKNPSSADAIRKFRLYLKFKARNR